MTKTNHTLPIDGDVSRKLFRALEGKIHGEWVLLGGALLPALGETYRVTYDIDLAALADVSQSETLALMEAAESIGLPIEAVNTAAAYFLLRINDFKKHLLPLFEGKNLKIFRPDVELYWRLKLSRLSETDALDCIRYLEVTQRRGETINRKALIRALDEAETPKDVGTMKRRRIEQLRKRFSENPS